MLVVLMLMMYHQIHIDLGTLLLVYSLFSCDRQTLLAHGLQCCHCWTELGLLLVLYYSQQHLYSAVAVYSGDCNAFMTA
jgi:hypothetical protein